jgi:AcrR family transcriptional regulator
LPEARKSQRTIKIVQAAGKLFARQGYHATSTREVAHLADVGENTVFRHFSSKEGLFWATLQAYFSELEFPKDLLAGLEQYDSPEVVLPKILELFADTADFRPELLRLIAVASVELQGKTDAFYQQHLSPVFSVINRYFETNIKSGKIRDLDPTMLTSALIMTALTHPRICSLIEGHKPCYSNRLKERRARAMFWLDILIPQLPADSDAGLSHNRG